MAGVTLVNPPERLRVWAGIPKAHAHGVYCFPPLGLMHIQAAVEKRSHYIAEICDPVVDDLDYPELLKIAQGVAKNRVVIKLPRYSETPKGSLQVSHQILGKSTRYDVFMINKVI